MTAIKAGELNASHIGRTLGMKRIRAITHIEGETTIRFVDRVEPYDVPPDAEVVLTEQIPKVGTVGVTEAGPRMYVAVEQGWVPAYFEAGKEVCVYSWEQSDKIQWDRSQAR